ncbi:N-alpha-acetyltransferase 35, NatC auxiliary subunit like [Pseudolycoriella hygida]|uniref:Protein MAK10 homolog n=1 Tax=Pseudolycoriella hygida TaxID=35572 RepID=A0A9Q0S2K7_9DIPT|nr:N-alpha-acetyltransferase 35, NatC auxiliary subunit like [Pseudolycoriella hygida]
MKMDKNSEEKVSSLEAISNTNLTEVQDTQNKEESKQPEVPRYEWKVITEEFFESVQELKLGELIHNEMFGLFEAMSAIEMMDPKMDAGMCCNKNTEPPLTFETAVSTNQLKLSNFEKSELIGIMDSVYSCLVSWLEGHSLAQTLFICLYLHQPYQIEDKSLKAFCCAIHKLAQIIRKFILYSVVYEEEDFEIRDYEYTLEPDMSNSKSCFMLKDAEDELTKRIKSGQDASEETMAIVNRLKFLRLVLQALVAIWPDRNISPTQIEMVEIQKLLSGAVDVMPGIKRTISLGTQPNDDSPNTMGFSLMVNQRMLPPTFPRYTKIKDRLPSMTFLEEFVQRTKVACRIIHFPVYQNALNFFMDFSRKNAPCLLSRSILQCLYFPQPCNRFGLTPISEVLKESARLFSGSPVLAPKSQLMNNPEVAKCVDTFFSFCGSVYNAFGMFIQICGFNKARQRDKLTRLLDEFGVLVDEAERVDAFLHSKSNDTKKEPLSYFSTWVLYHSLRAMSMYLLSGFELELYSIHEYIYIYWYLSQFLYNWIVSTLNRAECLMEHAKNATKQQKRTKPNKKKSVSPNYRELILNQSLSNMFNGYFKAMAGLTKEDRIPQPLPVFDKEQIRFEHRFAPFAGLLNLPQITYTEFNNMRTYFMMKSQSNELYLEAGKHFHSARIMMESIPNPDFEILDMIKVAKTNFVVMNLLARGHKKDSKTPPSFDFSLHKYFPIIKHN